jgi:signal transduction histidine kinase
MKYFQMLRGYGINFIAQYPAVLSGCIIYSYLFVSMVRLFIKVKGHGAAPGDIYDIFSALPFMWLLAVSLVKIIEFRAKLHTQEKELQVKNIQLTTMHEVVQGVQHQVNNPLAIISLSVDQAKRSVEHDPVLLKKIESIANAANQITSALQKFSEAEQYKYEHVDQRIGTIASIPDEH